MNTFIIKISLEKAKNVEEAKTKKLKNANFSKLVMEFILMQIQKKKKLIMRKSIKMRKKIIWN